MLGATEETQQQSETEHGFYASLLVSIPILAAWCGIFSGAGLANRLLERVKAVGQTSQLGGKLLTGRM